MKLNNKGFAVSSILYVILVLAVVLIALTLALLTNRKLILDKLRDEVLIDINELCKSVTEDTKTTGNVPTNDASGKKIYKLGDEYICEVKPGISYHFFVLGIEEERINLILNRNINSDGTLADTALIKENSLNEIYSLVPWIIKENYISAGGKSSDWLRNGNNKGPLTALAFIEEATKSWTNLETIDEKYIDENGQYGEINLTGKARMPKLIELETIGCTTSSLNNSCPIWAVDYLNIGKQNMISGMSGYWLLSSYSNKSANYLESMGFYVSTEDIDAENIGIRPVISVSKSNIN